jgi:hypothetical protein
MMGAAAVMGTAGMVRTAAMVVFGLGTAYENCTDQPCRHGKRLQRLEHDRTLSLLDLFRFFDEPYIARLVLHLLIRTDSELLQEICFGSRLGGRWLCPGQRRKSASEYSSPCFRQCSDADSARKGRHLSTLAVLVTRCVINTNERANLLRRNRLHFVSEVADFMLSPGVGMATKAVLQTSAAGIVPASLRDLRTFGIDLLVALRARANDGNMSGSFWVAFLEYGHDEIALVGQVLSPMAISQLHPTSLFAGLEQPIVLRVCQQRL